MGGPENAATGEHQKPLVMSELRMDGYLVCGKGAGGPVNKEGQPEQSFEET